MLSHIYTKKLRTAHGRSEFFVLIIHNQVIWTLKASTLELCSLATEGTLEYGSLFLFVVVTAYY